MITERKQQQKKANKVVYIDMIAFIMRTHYIDTITVSKRARYTN